MFKIGQKVVYVHVKIDVSKWGQISPDPNVVYTVRAVGEIIGRPMILLDEIRNAPMQWAISGFHELGMDASFFRPVVENKSEISFTTGADPESEKWDNRVRRKVRT